MGSGYQFAQELHALGGQSHGEVTHAGDVAARTIEARHQTELDRVGANVKHDWDRRGCGLGRNRRGAGARCDDHAHAAGDEVGGQRRQSLIVAIGPAEFEDDVLALDKACLSKALAEGRHSVSALSGRAGVEETDHWHGRLLPSRDERPHRRAAEQRDERAPFHSMSSSASNWSELGTSMPSALAVCMLITNSNLVACKTGSSAGFVPLR